MRPIRLILNITFPSYRDKYRVQIWINHYYYYILKLLYDATEPVSRNKLINRFRKEYPSYRKTIFTRSLKTMVKKGLITEFDDGYLITAKGKIIYESLRNLFIAYGVDIE